MTKTKAYLFSLVISSPFASAELSFEPAPFSIGGIHEAQIEFGDIRNDGNLSALLGGSGSIYSLNEKRETMLNSNSEFRADQTNDIFNLVDLNGDGLKDILSYPLAAYINDGQGHFGTTALAPVRALTNYGLRDVEIHYLDDNPYPDVVVMNYRRHQFSVAHVYKNVRYSANTKNGDLAFDELVTVNTLLDNIPGLENIVDVASGDLNGDGHTDLILANGVSTSSTSNGTLISLNDGQGGYLAPQKISNAQDIALADFDGDGDLDMYLARTNLQGMPFEADEVWLNDGNGFFENSGQLLGLTESQFARVADMDNDGDLDVVVVNENVGATSIYHPHLPQSGKIWLNDGQGVFADSGVHFGSDRTNQDLDLVDIDLDGDLDIVTRNQPANYDFGYASVNQVKLNQHEILLNTLIKEDTDVSDTTAGIAFCQSNPASCNLFTEMELLESYTLGFNDGVLSCQQNPESCGLYSEQDLLERESVVYQNGYDQGYQDGKSDGYTEGVEDGYAQGIEDGHAQGVDEGFEDGYAQGVDEGYEDGYNDGLEQGNEDTLAACQANPSECGIDTGADAQDILALIAAIRNDLPRGQAVSTCKKNPSAPLCWDSPEDIVSLSAVATTQSTKGKKGKAKGKGKKK